MANVVLDYLILEIMLNNLLFFFALERVLTLPSWGCSSNKCQMPRQHKTDEAFDGFI